MDASVLVPRKVICKGRQGFIFTACHTIDKKIYVVKQITYCEDDEERVYQEVRILSRLQHDNIVKYVFSWSSVNGENSLFHLELMARGQRRPDALDPSVDFAFRSV